MNKQAERIKIWRRPHDIVFLKDKYRDNNNNHMQEYYEPEYVSVFYSESLSRFNFKPGIFEQYILISAEKV